MTTAAPAIASLSTQHLLRDTDLSGDELRSLLRLAVDVKTSPRDYGTVLAGRYASMLFEKPSLRTHVTFEAGMSQLGGHAILLRPEQVGIGTRESTADVARNLSRWVDGLVARTYSHSLVEELAGSESPYERLLGDALLGDGALFTREDAVEAAWAVVDPVLGAHARARPYRRGTWGPRPADGLIAAPGRWYNPTADGAIG